MNSDLTCAFSGACLLAGGFAAILWGTSWKSSCTERDTDLMQGFLRSLSIHLQICWQVVPGRKFFWGSLLAGWGIPVLFASIALARTGVSYRFGDTCHINHDKALQDYWGPLLAFATVSTILQFVTLAYCIRVYIRALFKEDTRSYNSSELPSYQSSVRTVTARQAYRRVQKAIAIQWRGIVVVIIIIVNVVFLAIVFISMDNTVQAMKDNFSKAQPWLSCLVINGGDKNACLDKARGLTTPEPTVMAVLVLLSVCPPSLCFFATLPMLTCPQAQRIMDNALLWSIVHDICLDESDPKTIVRLPRFRLCRCSTPIRPASAVRNDHFTSSNGVER